MDGVTLLISIPVKLAHIMLLCALEKVWKPDEEEHHRGLLWFEHRFLAIASSTLECKDKLASEQMNQELS